MIDDSTFLKAGAIILGIVVLLAMFDKEPRPERTSYVDNPHSYDEVYR